MSALEELAQAVLDGRLRLDVERNYDGQVIALQPVVVDRSWHEDATAAAGD